MITIFVCKINWRNFYKIEECIITYFIHVVYFWSVIMIWWIPFFNASASQIFLQWSKKVFFFSMQICDGKREKRRSSFLLKKRSIFSNNSIKNLSLVLSLQVHHEWIAPWMLEIHMGAFRLKCQHVHAIHKSFLFSKQWNKSLDCNQAINKC